MILALIIGLVVGFFMSIPPGPISVAVIKNALDGHKRTGILIGIGAATMDTLYTLVAIFASSALVETLRDAILNSPRFLLGFQLAAVVTLVVLGVRYLRPKAQDVEKSTEKEMQQEARAKKLGYSSPYLVGVMISIANLATPTFFPGLIALASYVHTAGLVDNSIIECAAYAIGFGGGASLWFFTLLKALYKWREKLGANFISLIFRFAGWSFFLFAVVLLVRVALMTDWGSIF